MNNKSEMVPTLGLVEANRELNAKVVLYELGFDKAAECEVALALMASEQHIEIIDLAEATWDNLSSLQKRQYMVKAAKIIAAYRMVRFAPAL